MEEVRVDALEDAVYEKALTSAASDATARRKIEGVFARLVSVPDAEREGEKLGSGDALTGWDANYEMAKDEWTGILGLVKYDGEQLQRVSDALKEVGTEEVSFEGRTEEGPKDHSGRGDHNR